MAARTPPKERGDGGFPVGGGGSGSILSNGIVSAVARAAEAKEGEGDCTGEKIWHGGHGEDEQQTGRKRDKRSERKMI